MKTLTIRGIDIELSEKIKEKSKKSGESINKIILTHLYHFLAKKLDFRRFFSEEPHQH